MPIRKRRLHRPCKKCEKMFEPNGRTNWTCNKCQKANRRSGSFLDELMKLQRKVNRKNKRLK
jgi:tRNA(Ile2) C34 agmatinyltransferase TiaS